MRRTAVVNQIRGLLTGAWRVLFCRSKVPRHVIMWSKPAVAFAECTAHRRRVAELWGQTARNLLLDAPIKLALILAATAHRGQPSMTLGVSQAQISKGLESSQSFESVVSEIELERSLISERTTEASGAALEHEPQLGDARMADAHDWTRLHHIHCVVRSFHTGAATAPPLKSNGALPQTRTRERRHAAFCVP